jgi:hypothetical protein
MISPFRLSFVLALLACPVFAQSTAELKKELRNIERTAAKDPEALFEAGKWAAEKSLDADAKRLFEKVLKAAPEHVGANEALGNELFDGKWLPAKEAEKLRQKAMAAEYAAKGFKEVDGVWVEPDQVDDAKRGVFHHDGESVTKEQKLALMNGMVRHPETGRLIAAEFLEKAQNGYYPISDDRWVDRAEADKYHSELSRPWIVRSHYATLTSTLPLEKLLELKIHADQGQEKVAPLFGGRVVTPAKRPVVIIAKTEAEYKNYGNAFGDGTDVSGSFLMSADGERASVPLQGEVRAAICHNEKDWGPRWIRHAAAIGYVNAIAEEEGADLPLWFVHGVGSLSSRFDNDSDAGWFGKQTMARGGVGSVKAFFNGFAINGEMENTAVAQNVFVAGLMLSFATRGGNADVTESMVELTDALSGKSRGNIVKLIDKLEKKLIKAEDGITAHLKELIAKAP